MVVTIYQNTTFRIQDFLLCSIDPFVQNSRSIDKDDGNNDDIDDGNDDIDIGEDDG